ncbi:uncharacterized protein LOC127857468 [Dreissena polymorpha]|uniref:uncharacterized protein LOC127857468 n=1 Tax=Dreissena polymorpha TaxID=45954 RepID=UPI00226411DA|nr:uncharacterized protein LOC127857468 [Dreissena polymorpha]
MLQTTSKSEDTSSQLTTNVVTLNCTEITGVHRAMNIEKYSTYLKLLRVAAYVHRFIRNCRRPRDERLTNSLSATELKEAEVTLLRSCQTTNFQDEKHVLTKLIVFDVHKNQLHSGVYSTITQIRQKYWIPSIRQCVRSLLRTCIQCTRVTGRPYAAPDPPPLPKVRVSEAPPFSVTVVDFTGALFVKNATGSETKCYICLFTCASTRAVHLEVVQDLSTDSFLQAFRRFASRKSLPMVMISDNAATYIAAANHLKKLFNSQVLQEELSRKGTEWQFIPKRAPWYGGFWERLIGHTKTSLKKILGKRYVSMETLQTIVTEIEAVINDKPLTHVSSSIDDLEPLTPSHLLYGRKMTSLPHHTHLPDDEMTQIQSDQTTLTNRAKQQSDIIEQFWRRWKSEY